MSISNLEDLFEHTLKDIYFAENHIHKHLPDMIEKASSTKLKTALKDHRKETEEQIERLKSVFKILGKKAEGEECPAIEGIVEEAGELLSEIDDKSTRDAAIVSCAQAVEHYEITRYGTLITWATELDLDKEIKNLLRDTLSEEDSADEKLTALAEERLNEKAKG
ncbi:ferritin-like domain-containing protein [Notoacmeibacter ruber]|uniref:Ferritin-like domain-containing protein n=1 Tax=Notoacmeibacter ruber TaxID=2670375 RepID=A0A3L7JAB6_9HYPH|nr:ferritin-like domain-containing protein [Notoacmeibacter ruber]RLQ87399.1 ferritin-like domain-containing protein [Notoacmeibacter ruber]